MSRVRLGAVGYLNARPLVFGLDAVPRFQLRHRIGRGHLIDREPRERQAGDVHFLDGSPRVLQLIERRLRHQIETSGAQLFEERTKGHAVARGKLLEIGERKPGHSDAMRRFNDLSHALGRGAAACRAADDASLPRRGRHGNRRIRIRGDIRHPDERCLRPVTRATDLVGHDADADDVG